MKDYNEIISTCLRRAGSAVSGIMGERLLFIGQTGRFVELRDGVGQQLSEQILVRLEVSGAGGPPGDAWLAVNTADAIRLAGRLVMLPESELEEAVAANELEDEIHYAFLEMVNIISISFSKTLTELAGKPYLLKVVGEQEYPDYTMGDEHITAQDYYRVEASMVLGSQKLGKFVLLMLPRTMELEARLGTKQRVEKAVKKAAENNAVASGTNSETPSSALKALLSEFRLLIAQEFSVLLGMEVGCFGENGLSIDLPQPLLDPVLPAKAAAHLIISGECTAEAYLVADIEDAIRLAGHFLALPAVELEAAIASGIFDSDLQDGFSEIANLVAGLCSLLFDKRYQASVIFDKKEILQTELEENHPAENEQQAEPTVDLTLAEPAADKGQTSANRVYPVEIHLYAQNELIGGFDFLFPSSWLISFSLNQRLRLSLHTSPRLKRLPNGLLLILWRLRRHKKRVAHSKSC